MDTRKILARRALTAALFLFGCSTNAAAVFEDDQPTTEEAHAFLGGTFQRYPVSYASEGRQAMTRAAAYGGDACVSQLGRGTRAVKVNWSQVSSVEQAAGNAVDLQGAGPRSNLRVHFPNERAARSAANAFEVLRSACVPPALTARR